VFNSETCLFTKHIPESGSFSAQGILLCHMCLIFKQIVY